MSRCILWHNRYSFGWKIVAFFLFLHKRWVLSLGWRWQPTILWRMEKILAQISWHWYTARSYCTLWLHDFASLGKYLNSMLQMFCCLNKEFRTIFISSSSSENYCSICSSLSSFFLPLTLLFSDYLVNVTTLVTYLWQSYFIVTVSYYLDKIVAVTQLPHNPTCRIYLLCFHNFRSFNIMGMETFLY